jgi:leader peptidase (prepilin peptidase)/N-methyltransferase
MGLAVELINGWILPVLLAPAVGSFLGVLVRRLPRGRPIAASRSACEACGHVLGPLEMVPLLSFAWQRGRCRHCGAPIAAAHPSIELSALGVAAVAACLVPAGADLWIACVLGWWLLTLAWIDAEHFTLPDVLTLPLLLAGLAEAIWRDPDQLTARAAAAALAYGALWALAAGYRRLRGREGLGMGDAKLLAAGGAWLGPVALPRVLLLGACSALAYALLLRLRGTRITGTLKLPFGPFLAGAIWLVWLWLAYEPSV